MRDFGLGPKEVLVPLCGRYTNRLRRRPAAVPPPTQENLCGFAVFPDGVSILIGSSTGRRFESSSVFDVERRRLGAARVLFREDERVEIDRRQEEADLTFASAYGPGDGARDVDAGAR